MGALLDRIFPVVQYDSTVNSVNLPHGVRMAVWAILAGTAAAVLLRSFLLSRRLPDRSVLAKAALASFLASGLAWAAFADVKWSLLLSDHQRKFGGMTTAEKVSLLDAPWGRFIGAAREAIPDSYRLFTTQEDENTRNIALRIEYGLLPLRKRDDAPFLVVVRDWKSRYDPATGVFSSGSLVLPDTYPVLEVDKYVYVLVRGAR